MQSILRTAIVLGILAASQPALAEAERDDAAMAAFRDGAFAEALTGWMRAAENGDAVAARHVGVLFDTGQGVPQDQAAALRWYRRAAALGDVPAMFNVAVCFDAGRGTGRDPARAAYWYGEAARRRFGRAEYNLALMEQQGDGVPANRQAAQGLFRAALQDGIAAARLHLPTETIRPVPGGRPVVAPTQPAPAPSTSDAVFASAQQALLGRSPDASSRAAALFAQAADGSGAAGGMARYDLAWCYQNGIGVAIDRPRAYRMFIQVAAETDDPVLGGLARMAAERAAAQPVMALSATHPAEGER